MTFYRDIESDELDTAAACRSILSELEGAGYDLSRTMAVPPDITRLHSGSGELLKGFAAELGDRLTDVLPAVGTHEAMSEAEIARMYPGVSPDLFRPHDFRNDIVTLGEIESDFIRTQSEGKLDFPYPAQVNHRIAAGEHGCILSIGQVVPHEVVGMANHSKNIFVGTGGVEAIDRSHYLSAVYGMERIMGVADTPVRRVLDRAAAEFLRDIPVVYVLTVVSAGAQGHPKIVGLFAGDDDECFYEAAELARKHNVIQLDRAPETVVVYLDPDAYRSTWLGNKAIYRTRKAIADGGELVVVAPGVHHFGEDADIDVLIRRHGYRGTAATLEAVERDPDMAAGLSAAAHLIHGSSEGRFSVTYATDKLTREEVEGVGYRYADLNETLHRFHVNELEDGWNHVDAREVYFVSQPGLGLWESPVSKG